MAQARRSFRLSTLDFTNSIPVALKGQVKSSKLFHNIQQVFLKAVDGTEIKVENVTVESMEIIYRQFLPKPPVHADKTIGGGLSIEQAITAFRQDRETSGRWTKKSKHDLTGFFCTRLNVVFDL